MNRYGWAIACALAVLVAASAVRGALGPLIGPPSLDDRVMAIAAQVRCPVCSGESAAQSDTEPSVHIRAEIAGDLAQGWPEGRILQQIASEYGTWILYRPPYHGVFAVAWLFPALGVAAALALLVAYLRRREVRPAPTAAPAEGGDAGPPPDEELRRRLRRFM